MVFDIKSSGSISYGEFPEVCWRLGILSANRADSSGGEPDVVDKLLAYSCSGLRRAGCLSSETGSKVSSGRGATIASAGRSPEFPPPKKIIKKILD